jgi:hypothetical protein
MGLNYSSETSISPYAPALTSILRSSYPRSSKNTVCCTNE